MVVVMVQVLGSNNRVRVGVGIDYDMSSWHRQLHAPRRVRCNIVFCRHQRLHVMRKAE
jgi:hypothetical protein